MAKGCVSTSLSSLNLLQLPWFLPFLVCFLSVISFATSLSSSTVSYTYHCGSIVPKSDPTIREYAAFYPSLEATTSYFDGGERIFGKNSYDQFSFYPEKSLRFRNLDIYNTNTSGVYKIKSVLNLRSFGSRNISRRPLKFSLDGFWSVSSGKLCMVGSASWFSKEGKHISLAAVLKLAYASKANISNSLVSGSLESLSSNNDVSYFEPISILAFPLMDHYTYTLASKEFGQGCPGGIDDPHSPSLRLQPGTLCSRHLWQFTTFMLVYERECKSLKEKNCSPFGAFRPHSMSLYAIQCSDNEQKLRYLIKFSNSSYFGYYSFNPNTTLIAEGIWDDKKNRLCVVACRILNATDTLRNVPIVDCSIRLSLRFPAVWNISSSNHIVGQIWTNKGVDNLNYFRRIMFRSFENNLVNDYPQLKYEYTQIGRVREKCPVKKSVKKDGERYPEGHSYDMRFDMSTEDSRVFSWGSAAPIFVGDQLYDSHHEVLSSSEEGHSDIGVAVMSGVDKSASSNGSLHISYKIALQQTYNFIRDARFSSLNLSSSPYGQVEFSAEGLYEAETGQLCMVGCRELGSFFQGSNFGSLDCKILINFQFAPVNAKKASSIKGSIVSMRKKTDPLYFEHLNLSSLAFYTTEAKRSIWRMDLEVVMVLISNTLSCIFVALQIFHVKKHPVVLPSISLITLLILTLGYMIPLVLNFEALLFRGHNAQGNELRWGGGWIEVNEVAVRVVTMVAFLLQARLLQLAWTSKLGDGNVESSWPAEKKSLLITSPIYLLGTLLALFVNWKKNPVVQQHSLWGDLRSYAGLVLDGFLFPQIILNILRNSIESALSRGFYTGTSFVRLLPHAYDLYRAHNYPQYYINSTYIYANPRADFYSAAWDVIIPFVVLLFALIIYLQQRFGGCYLIPKRLRELKDYEMVPVTSSE